MDEYKGIYYGDEKEQKFYEAGAHFKYIKLYKILEKIAKERNQKEREKELLRIRKLKNLSRIMNKKNQNKTRNIISHLDVNKLGFNTISNNSNKNNYMFNYKFMISLNKNRNKTKSKSKSKSKNKNFSLTNHKKDIDSRNKYFSKDMKGRPNTILKKMIFPRNNRLLSSSMEQKKKSKIKFPIKIKRSLPEFSTLKPKKFRNYSNNKKPTISSDAKINIHTNLCRVKDDGNKSVNIHMNYKNYKAEDDRSDIINNISNLKYRKDDDKSDNVNIFIYNNTTNEQSNISDSNGNKFSTKANGLNLPEEEKNEKKEIENYTDAKNIKKNPDYFYNKINYTNSIEISKKTHKIINKKFNVNKKAKIRIRTKSLKSSEINDNDSEMLSRSKIDKDKLHTFNKSSKKKNYKSNIKKDFYIHNHTFIIKSNFNNQFYRILKDFNKRQIEEKSLLNKKLNYKKKIEKNLYSKINNNQLSFNKFSSKSRNYNGNNTTFQAKNTFNHNNINNKNKNYYKIFMDINKTYYNNGIYRKINLNKSGNKSKSKSKSSNRNTSKLSSKQNKKYKFTFKQHKKINTTGNEFPKSQYIIRPYAHLKPNNEFRNKVNLKSIKLSKKHNEYIQELSNENNGIHKYI